MSVHGKRLITRHAISKVYPLCILPVSNNLKPLPFRSCAGERKSSLSEVESPVYGIPIIHPEIDDHFEQAPINMRSVVTRKARPFVGCGGA